jgi:transposase
LGAIVLLTETGDIHRFSNNEQLHSFVGLIPDVYSSGESERIGGITARHNCYLRPVIAPGGRQKQITGYLQIIPGCTAG